MGKRNRHNKGQGFFDGNFWQSYDYNQRSYLKNLQWIVSLAVNRFKWVGLPETCNARFLERTLLQQGIATIAHDAETPDVWLSLMCVNMNKLNMYGEPVEWRAQGLNGETSFNADWSSGTIIYDNNSFTNPWNAIQLFARKLTHYERTEDVNLSHQQTPWVFTAPEEKKLELVNLMRQVAGGEPAIIGNHRMMDNIHYEVLSTQTPYIGADLAIGRENTWRDIYRYLGISYMQFEKNERMVEKEITENSAPTIIKRLDALDARRKAANYLNDKFGLEIEVVFNDDVESYNFAFMNDIEKQGQLIADGNASAEDGMGKELNGAQVTSMLGVIQNYKNGLLDAAQAQNILVSSFGFNEEQAKGMLG